MSMSLPFCRCPEVKVQPHSVDFYHAVRDSGREVRELLTESLARFSTLTEANLAREGGCAFVILGS